MLTSSSLRSEAILRILDACCDARTFPALDNGYLYLAATRLSLFRSPDDWALVIETFGFSPREGTPATEIHTFASRLCDRNSPESYVVHAAYARYVAENPHNELRSAYPFGEIDWSDGERVRDGARAVTLRGRRSRLPERREYGRVGIELSEPGHIRLFEACRYFAAVARDEILATSSERRVSVPPEVPQLLQLEEWHHPDVVAGHRPSQSPTFRALALVLESGDAGLYSPDLRPNTHWSNWPRGGTL